MSAVPSPPDRFVDVLRLAVSTEAETVLLMPGAACPSGFKVLEGIKREEALQRAHAELAERGRQAGERIAAEERSCAQARREQGAPPVAPVHPELVPELQDEFERWKGGA